MLEGSAQFISEVELAFGVPFDVHQNINVFCPFHEEETTSRSRSCSVGSLGLFHCKSCGEKGTHYTFYARRMGLTESDARALLAKELAEGATIPRSTRGRFNTAVGALPPLLDATCHTALWNGSNDKWLNYLRKDRGLTDETLRRFQIGCDEYRITIPVYNEDGELVNMRRYLPGASEYGSPKMVSHKVGDATPRLWPAQILDTLPLGSELIVCEGEWDCMLLNQHGFPAITNTGNCKVWSEEWTALLCRYNLVFMYDVNDKFVQAEGADKLGQRQARMRAADMTRAGASVKVVDLPLPLSYVGGDVTNWFVSEKKTAKDLRLLIDSTPGWVNPETSAPAAIMGEGVKAESVTLHGATDAVHYFKPIRVRCLVAGHGAAPYLAPKNVKIEVYPTDGKTGPTETKEIQIDAWDGRILQLINCSNRTQKSILRTIAGVDPDAPMSVEIIDTMNVEEVHLIPTVEYDQDQGPYVLRKAFFVGKGLESNRIYDFLGFTLPDPNTQQATHLFVSATPAESNIDAFTLSTPMVARLKSTFSTKDINAKLDDIARQQSTHITHIHGRNDLHIAVDLAFHAPLSFDFEGIRLRKGWLDVLILGDTRTGKGFVTEGLARHYRVGEVVSGENLTLAGIVGGVQHIGDRWTLVWGKIPLADKRLVILDECGSLSHSDIGKLSRIRSEGIAEITKVISEKTTARTRIIWLGNPRPSANATMPVVMSDFNYGIEAVPALVGSAEDVARFDYALIVSRDDVPLDKINTAHSTSGPLTYTSELCHALVMWAWSRRPEQIIFGEEVTALALKAAMALGRTFSSRVCLIQGADVRHKLARIAAAVAARTFSTDDGEHLIVRREHMEFAYNFLYHIYSKNTSGYLALSQAETDQSVLRNPAAVLAAIEIAGPNAAALVDGLLESRLITLGDICDHADLDLGAARTVLSALVRARAITKEHHGYAKKEPFKKLLRQLKSHLARSGRTEPHATEGETTDDGHDGSDGNSGADSVNPPEAGGSDAASG